MVGDMMMKRAFPCSSLVGCPAELEQGQQGQPWVKGIVRGLEDVQRGRYGGCPCSSSIVASMQSKKRIEFGIRLIYLDVTAILKKNFSSCGSLQSLCYLHLCCFRGTILVSAPWRPG